MCSYLTQDIELRVVQHYVGPDSQTVVREHCDCLEAGAKLPSYVLEDAEMTELCVRARGDEDWSQDVQLERRDKSSSSSVVQVWLQKMFLMLLLLWKKTHLFVAADWTTGCGQSDPLLLGSPSGSFPAWTYCLREQIEIFPSGRCTKAVQAITQPC